MDGKENNKTSSSATIILVLIVAIISSLGTLFIAKNFLYKNGTNGTSTSNIEGTWYSTYAGQTFLLSLKKDKTFEFGYEGSDMTKGNYNTSSTEVLNLMSDSGTDKIIYNVGKNYIEINSTKYYSSKDEAAKNDGYYYVPDDYDTSMFTKITAAEMIKKFNNGDAAFVLTARGSCGYCQQFRPVAAESVKKYNYTLYYLDTTTLTDADYENIKALDSKFNGFGSTPNVYYFKGKAVVDIQEGAADANTYGSFLEKNGVKAK